MRKIGLFFLFLSIFTCVYGQPEMPKPSGWVNDFAQVISPEYKEKIDSLISEIERKTSAEISVVTVKSCSPYNEFDYAQLLFDNWKIGKPEKNNGVLILLAVNDRNWRIHVGYGLEGVLPDSLCGEIGRTYMVPYFKDGNFGEGLYYGVAAISDYIAKDARVNIARLEGVPLKGIKEKFPFYYFLVFPVIAFIIGLPFRIAICLPIIIIFAFIFLNLSWLLSLLIIIGYSLSLAVRYLYWKMLPPDTRKKFTDSQSYGNRDWSSSSGSWGGFGGGSSGGWGGFGGGSCGGAGAGGSF